MSPPSVREWQAYRSGQGPFNNQCQFGTYNYQQVKALTRPKDRPRRDVVGQFQEDSDCRADRGLAVISWPRKMGMNK